MRLATEGCPSHHLGDLEEGPCPRARSHGEPHDRPGRELLDRILIMNQRNLRKVLAEYETHFSTHRPHRALNQASPLRALPDPVDADIKVIRRERLGGLLHEYTQV